MRKLFLFILILSAYSCSAQETKKNSLMKLEVKVRQGSHGKLFGNRLIYLGMGNSLSSMATYVKSIKKDDDRLLMESTYSPPIGWIDDSSILMFKKESSGNYLYRYDIDKRNIISKVTVDLVIEPEYFVANDGDVLIYSNHYLKDPEQMTFVHNLNTGVTTRISELSGKKIRRLAYNKNNNRIALFALEEDKKKLLVLDSGNIKQIFDYNQSADADESPFTFSDDGDTLYFIDCEDGKCTLRRYQFDRRDIKGIYDFSEGVNCVDMSYSRGRLLITIDNEDKIGFTERIDDGKYDYELGLETSLSMYILDISSKSSESSDFEGK